MMHMKRALVLHKTLHYLILAVFLAAALIPIYWMINTSFKQNAEIYRINPTLWPEKFDFAAGYEKLLHSDFPKQLRNSFYVSMTVSVVSVLISFHAAYAIARMNFAGRRFGSRFILYCYLLPSSIMFIPMYMVVTKLGLSDSLLGLIVVYPTFVIPYATWILTAYLQSISKDIEQSAIVDGCTRIGAMYRIVFPLASPGIVSTFIFSFTMCWSEFLYSLVIITSRDHKTMTVGLADLIVTDIYPWAALSAGAVFSTIPVLLLFVLASRYVTTGLTAGGVKA